MLGVTGYVSRPEHVTKKVLLMALAGISARKTLNDFGQSNASI